MNANNALARHLHTFFHEYLIAQRNVSPHTVLSYRDSLKLLLRFAMARLGKTVSEIGLDDLDVDTVLAFLDHIEDKCGNTIATRNSRLSAVHSFYRHVASRDPVKFQLCQSILCIPAKRSPRKEIHYLEPDEMDAVLKIDRSTPEGRRDHTMLALAYQTGLRVHEIVSVRASDLQLDSVPQIRVWGKGRKERIIPLWSKTAALLRALLEERNIDPRSAAIVFVNSRGCPLTRWGFRYILKKHAQAAALKCPTISSKRIHPHVIRHTTAVHMLEAGVDPSAIRDILGHENAETTWRYTRIRMERKRKVMEAYLPPRSVADSKMPAWKRDPDLISQLESIGR